MELWQKKTEVKQKLDLNLLQLSVENGDIPSLLKLWILFYFYCLVSF